MTLNVKPWLVAALMAVSFIANSKTITVEHALGTTQLDTKPERVVVLGMDTLDILDYLDIEPIGVVKAPIPSYLTDYQDDKYISVGTLHEPDFETIFTLKPDLIIASNRSSTAYEELSKIAPTVVFMADAQKFWQTTQQGWRMFGQIFEIEQKVESLISKTEEKIDAVKVKTEAKDATALMVMTNGGNVTTFGSGSRYNAIFDEFGFKQLVHNDKALAHGELISFEFISQANPDYILLMDRDKAIGRTSGEAKQDFYNALVGQTNAAKNDRITELDSQAWYISASGITATNIMIEDMNRALR